MNGVINGVYYCNNERVDELNERIASRNIPSQKLQAQFDVRPVSTKYAMMPILDRRAVPTVHIEKMPNYSCSKYIIYWRVRVDVISAIQSPMF